MEELLYRVNKRKGQNGSSSVQKDNSDMVTDGGGTEIEQIAPHKPH